MNAPAPTTLLADYYVGGRHRAPVLVLYRIVDGVRVTAEVHEVSGRRDARQVAKDAGATPWNF